MHTADSLTDAFAARFADRAGPGGVLSFADFMDLALYDRQTGYYTSNRVRVGRSTAADFVTSSSFNLVFGPLVAGAAQSLLAPNQPSDHAFVEIGTETQGGILDNHDHPFAATQTIRIGEAISIPEHAVVFSNELFDAQPFHRVVLRDRQWRELGVSMAAKAPSWIELPEFSPEVAAVADRLPAAAPEGYIIDLPLRAQRLLDTIAKPSWKGLFIAFDYGRTWGELTRNHPEGTGRAYYRHRLSSGLLARPGMQDLTCHVCWDWMEQTLADNGFESLERSSQESFFLRHAAPTVARFVADHPGPLTTIRSQLKQLLHPGLMGQRFEVLSAKRR